MLQYLIILLDDTSTSFCHYKVSSPKKNLIPLDLLKRGIRFGMMSNLMIQYVYPDYDLPSEYAEVIESIDHSKIKPSKDDADIWVVESIKDVRADVPVVWRTDKQGLLQNEEEVYRVLENVPRLNIVLTDIETFKDEDFDAYKSFLERLSAKMKEFFLDAKIPQLNLLTDRMLLRQVNHCGAGDTSITLAPNGKFYICPAFYYTDETDSVGDLARGLDVRNKQLYKLEYAPICRHCDAYHCKRCVWLNRKTTLEVNTPSHEQCVVAHLERNASRQLLLDMREYGTFFPEQEEIRLIDYLDPFDKRDEW